MSDTRRSKRARTREEATSAPASAPDTPKEKPAKPAKPTKSTCTLIKRKRPSTAIGVDSPATGRSKGPEQTLPVKIAEGQPLPTLSEPQPLELPLSEWQDYQQSGVLIASLEQSRAVWVSGVNFRVFHKFFSQPKKPCDRTEQDKALHARQKNLLRDFVEIGVVGHSRDTSSLAKEMPVQAQLVIEPHTFPIRLYAPKEYIKQMPKELIKQMPKETVKQKPKETVTQMPKETVTQMPKEAIKQSYGSWPNHDHPHHSWPNKYPQYQGQYVYQLNPPKPRPPPPKPVRKTPAPTPAPAVTPAPDPVIHMLAQRAGINPRLKSVMRIVALGEASKEELEFFQSHISDLTAVLEKQQEEAAKLEKAPPQPPQPQPQPQPTTTPKAVWSPPMPKTTAPSPAPQQMAAPPPPLPRPVPPVQTVHAPQHAPQHTSQHTHHTLQHTQHTPQHTHHTPQHTHHTPQHTHHTPQHTHHTQQHAQHTQQHAQHTPQRAQNTPQHAQNTPQHAQNTPQHAQNTPQHAQNTPQHAQNSYSPFPPQIPLQHAPPRPSHSPHPNAYNAAPQQHHSSRHRSNHNHHPQPSGYRPLVFTFEEGTKDYLHFPSYSILEWLPNMAGAKISFLITKMKPKPEQDAVVKSRATPAPEAIVPAPGAMPSGTPNVATPVTMGLGQTPNGQMMPPIQPSAPPTPTQFVPVPRIQDFDEKHDIADIEFYQPITVLVITNNHEIRNSLVRAIRPPDVVKKYMNEVFDKCKRAEETYLAFRLPRDHEADQHVDKKIRSGNDTPAIATLPVDSRSTFTASNLASALSAAEKKRTGQPRKSLG